jgi:hypothetical protein
VIEHRQTELTGQVALEQRAHGVAAAMVVATHEHTKVTSHEGRRLQLRDGEPFAAVSHPRDATSMLYEYTAHCGAVKCEALGASQALAAPLG